MREYEYASLASVFPISISDPTMSNLRDEISLFNAIMGIKTAMHECQCMSRRHSETTKETSLDRRVIPYQDHQDTSSKCMGLVVTL